MAMDKKSIIDKIVELKLQKPQTQKIKLEIQKLQQKLNKWKNFTEVNQVECFQEYVEDWENTLIQTHYYGDCYL